MEEGLCDDEDDTVSRCRRSQRNVLRGWRIATTEAECPPMLPNSRSHAIHAHICSSLCTGGQMSTAATPCSQFHVESERPSASRILAYSSVARQMVCFRCVVANVAMPVTMTLVSPVWRWPYCETIQDMGTRPRANTASVIPHATLTTPLSSRKNRERSKPEERCGRRGRAA
jgi:hypothetical protein